ncbi:hypothetical protein TRIUR3_31709 [Triticum urartu]|uniref:Uncharacterized protein n=1 Tax=Triticum urartu TaxID=4572 RepID=M8AQ77_TRIUA|nr:hypothetical protein TRIUR3_31709 [Triticum urartu]
MAMVGAWGAYLGGGRRQKRGKRSEEETLGEPRAGQLSHRGGGAVGSRRRSAAAAEMLEDQVAFLLQKYLGNYVRGLSKEALKISVWRGHPFAAGLVLSKLSAVTVDDHGKETFATGGDLDRVKKV